MSNEQIKSQREAKTEGVQCNKGGGRGGEREREEGGRERERESDLSDLVSQLNDTGPTWERRKAKLSARNDESKDR